MRPHPRLRRDRRWTLARLWAYPALAVASVFAFIGWTQPEMIDREYVDGGWRWLLTWSMRPLRYGVERVSRRTYRTWQTAVDGLARTDVGRYTAPHSPDTWQQHAPRPWEPEPMKE